MFQPYRASPDWHWISSAGRLAPRSGTTTRSTTACGAEIFESHPSSSLSETERCRPSIKHASIRPSKPQSGVGHRFEVRAVREKVDESTSSSSPEEVTEKFGLEAGLWKIFSSKDEGAKGSESSKSKGNQAKELFSQVGISVDETGEIVGTYAAHKAASPIRFPLTVALTPVVASWIGKMKKQK